MPRVPVYYVPRDYQLPVWTALVEERTHKRAALIWPRRHGKDLTALNIIALHALTVRVGNYYYFAPTYAQGRKIIWDGKMKDGRQFLSCFPGYPNTVSEDPDSVIASIDRRDMKIELKNGSLFQVVGAGEAKDNVVGPNLAGLVFTEYAVYRSSEVWSYMSPIALENDSLVIFTYTIRGFNHGWHLYQKTKNSPRWHTEFHTIDTALHDGKPVVTWDQVQLEIDEGAITEELAQQEYYNDPYASSVGAYYAKEMRKCRDEGRIGNVPYDPNYPVHTSWDIGLDGTAVWFFQVDHMTNVNVIDFYYASGVSLVEVLKVLREKPYVYGDHFGPHDLKNADFKTGKSTLEVALQYGVRFVVLPKLPVHDGIGAVRLVLPRCRFDEDKCFMGLDALRQYGPEETGMVDMYGRPIFSDKPRHDASSHPADAFRYLALAIDKCSGYTMNSNYSSGLYNLPDKGVSDYDILGF